VPAGASEILRKIHTLVAKMPGILQGLAKSAGLFFTLLE
jgi:hypothetical protein